MYAYGQLRRIAGKHTTNILYPAISDYCYQPEFFTMRLRVAFEWCSTHLKQNPVANE